MHLRVALIFITMFLNPVFSSAKVLQIVAGQEHACALFSTNQVRCWGANGYARLGSGNNAAFAPGTFSNIDLGTKEKILELSMHSSGGYHACALFESGRVKCWGYNGAASLGYGDANDRGDQPNEMGTFLPFVNLGDQNTPKVFHLNKGYFSNCAIFENGKAKCWGYNGQGQLGYPLGDTLGDQPAEMGNGLPFLQFGVNEKVLQIEGGELFSCALLESGRVKCWGYNEYGQLGLENTNPYGGRADQPIENLSFLSLGKEPVTQIAAGLYHVCALFKNNRVKCWGLGTNGNLGYGDTVNRGDKAGQMGDNLPYVDLGTQEKITQLYASYSHTCAVFESGRAKCWGTNGVGQLGLGDTSTRGNAPNQMGSKLPFIDFGRGVKVSRMALGMGTTCVILAPIFELKCYGQNSVGQLGYPSIENRGDKPDQLGENLPYVDFGDKKAVF